MSDTGNPDFDAPTGTVPDYIMPDDDLLRIHTDIGKITPFPLTPAQEIRAKALDSVCRLYARSYDDIMAEAKFTQFWNRLREFEAYIKDGEPPKP